VREAAGDKKIEDSEDRIFKRPWDSRDEKQLQASRIPLQSLEKSVGLIIF